MRKSYHSIVVPTVLAITARRRADWWSTSDIGPRAIVVTVMAFPPGLHSMAFPRDFLLVVIGVGIAQFAATPRHNEPIWSFGPDQLRAWASLAEPISLIQVRGQPGT